MTRTNKKNICFLISNLSGGGAQRVVSTLSRMLFSHYNLFIILHDAKKIAYDYQGSIVDLNTPVPKNVFLKAFNFILRIYRLKRIKRKLKPAAVVSYMEGSNFINLVSGNTGKTIISVRNYQSKLGKGYLGKLNKFLIRKLYRKSNLIIAVSDGVKADLVDNFQLDEGKINVINNPYDLEYINKKALEPLEEQYSSFFKYQVIVTAGSLMRQKGQWHLIRAFNAARKEIPEMKLVILGEGGLKSYFQQLIEELNMTDDVLMPGYKSNPFKFMTRSTAFILPSLFEGFPNVLLEAMTLGIPVIAADCPSGPREILAPDTNCTNQAIDLEYASYGLLVPVCDGTYYRSSDPLTREEEIMGRAIITLHQDRELLERYTLKSKQRAEYFEAGRIARQWVELIEG